MSSPSMRARMLDRLRTRGIDEESIADQLAMVIKGETVEKLYAKVDKTGNLKLKAVKTRRSPKDMAAGAILYDALSGGGMGISPKVLQAQRPAQDLYARFVPKVDNRIIATSAPSATAPSATVLPPVEVLQPEPEPEPENPVVQIILNIASKTDEDDENGRF